MTSIKGILKSSDIGIGGFILLMADGTQCSLHGNIPTTLINQKVEVKGKAVMSAMMVGKALEVISITAVPQSRSDQQK